MGDQIYISSYDMEDWEAAFICGTGGLSSTICGVPSEDVDGPGVYQRFNGKYEKVG